MNIRYIIVLSALIGFGQISVGQDLLSLEEAIQVALENNYGILVSKNDAQISGNNAHRGAAGLLPTVAANGGGTFNVGDTYIEFNSSEGTGQSLPDINATGIATNNLNAAIQANYVVFDGMGNVNRYQVLKQSAELSETQTQAVIEATISQVATAYFAIARLTESYNTLGESLKISRSRLDRAKNQFDFGGTNKLAILNAEVDVNTDSANQAVANTNLDNAKRNLNALIGRAIGTDFEVNTEVDFSKDMDLEALISAAEAHNSQVRLAEYGQRIAELNLKVAKAGYSPVFALNAGYSINRQDNGPAGFFKIQRSNGLALGGTISIPIFSANQRKVNVQNSQISILNAQHRYDEAKLNLSRDLSNAYYTFESTIQQLELEQKSLESAQENFTRTEEAFKLGQSTSVQFRTAQLNLLRVQDRINDLRFTAKLSEIELQRLSGQLTGQ